MKRLAHSEDLRHLLCVSDGRPAGDREFCFRGPSHSVHEPRFAIMPTRNNKPLACRYAEPPIGIEPMTYALREACALATQALPAQTARRMAREALIPLEFRDLPVHAPVHAKSVT